MSILKIKTMKNFIHYILLSLLVIVSACEPNELDTLEPEAVNEGLENFVIPANFNFATERTVNLNITDETPFVKYEVYGYSSQYGNEAQNILEAFNNKIYEGRPENGVVNHVFSLSDKYDKVYIARKDGLEYTYEINDVSNNVINFTSPYATRSANGRNPVCDNESSVSACPDCNEYIFENGDFECGPVLPDGPGQGNVDILVNEHSTLGWSSTTDKLRIIRSGWEIDGLPPVPAQNGLYFSELNSENGQGNPNPSGIMHGKDVYQRVCTVPGSTITWSFWHRGRNGVDEAVLKIGTDLSSITIEDVMQTSNVEGYINDEGLVALPGNNGWIEYTGSYTVPLEQYDTYFMLEALSTSDDDPGRGNFIDHVVLSDAGASGDVSNCPNPPTDSIFYEGTLAFEDKWPISGDYDFNDMVMNYEVEFIVSGSNPDLVRQINYTYHVKHAVAAFNNGFAIELEGIDPTWVVEADGAIYDQTYINNNLNGTEFGQRNAVIVLFDSASNRLGETNTVTIEFDRFFSLSTYQLVAPFNPFIIKNSDRAIEIHLPTKTVTDLATRGGSDEDINQDFKDPSGMPWAINISGDFKAPREGVDITDGYMHFEEWAISGGISYPDWFADNPGYRDDNMLLN
jgi:LruC domain-containing protein